MLLVVFFYIFFSFLTLKAQPTPEISLSASGLDSLLQDYAFRGMVNPRTGVSYNGNVPTNLTGIKVAAMRVRSGSLRRRGVTKYKEFRIPIGLVEQPYVERLVLVYHNLGNWSELYYPLPGYTYLAPVLGLLAYNGSDLSAKNLPEIDFIQTSLDSMRINFTYFKPKRKGGLGLPKCVYFGLHGSVEFDNVVDQNVCLSRKQGHFSIVDENIESVPSPSPTPANRKGKKRTNIIFIIGCVIGGVLLLVILGVILVYLNKCRKVRKMARMEVAADRGEPLMMANVRNTRAPMATEIRTRPSLEDEYVVI